MKLPFLTSTNFWTNFITLLTLIFAAYGIAFPEAEAIGLKDAIFKKDLAAIVLAGFNFVNIVYHIFFKKPAPTT